MVFGLIDTSYIDWPSNIDAAYLRGLQTRSGLNFTDLASRLDAGIASVNNGLDPLIATLLAPPTTTEFARGGRSGSMKAQKKSQYTVARPQQVERTAHMLALDEFEIAIGFTKDGLMEIGVDDFQAQVDALVAGLERAARVETLARLFSDAEVVVDPINATTATSPGFAGSGTSGNVFTGQYPDGTDLPGGYTHYYRDTTTNRAAVIKSARDRLKKWAPGPYDLIGSDTFISAVVALGSPDYVPAGSSLIRPADNTAQALVDATQFVGVFAGDIRVHLPLIDYTEDTGALVKTYGSFSANNPLVWRYDSMRGLAAYVDSRAMFPLAESVAMWKFGANVNNRVGAALIRIAASGAYAAPTLTY